MKEITLVPRTREGYHAFFSGYEQDPVLFADPALFAPYVYSYGAVEAFASARLGRPDRTGWFAVRDGRIIGDVGFKHMDDESRSCEVEICMQKDEYKSRGYGTQALRLALEQAFGPLGMETVRASILLKNARSRHVFEKAGFRKTGEDGLFSYYRLDRGDRAEP